MQFNLCINILFSVGLSLMMYLFRSKYIIRLEWPSQSPDLYPFGNLSEDLKCSQPNGIKLVFLNVKDQETFSSLSNCEKIVDSNP